MLKEFKEFAMRGNVVDMAVGIIIGAAFTTVVKSLVNNIIMPPIGLLIGGVDFSDLFVVLKPGHTPGPYLSMAVADKAGAVVWGYGAFINTVISFIIVSFAVFMLVRALMKMKRPPPAAAPTTKDCPQCATSIPIAAKRCPHCTSQL